MDDDVYEEEVSDSVENEDDQLEELLNVLSKYCHDNHLPLLTHPNTFNLFKNKIS